MVRPLNLILEMYEHRQTIDTDHLQFGEMTKNCNIDQEGQWKLMMQLNKLIWVWLQIAENTGTNPDDGFVIQIKPACISKCIRIEYSVKKEISHTTTDPKRKRNRWGGEGKQKCYTYKWKSLSQNGTRNKEDPCKTKWTSTLTVLQGLSFVVWA